MSCYESGKFFGAVFVTDLMLWVSLEEWEWDGDAQGFFFEGRFMLLFVNVYGELWCLVGFDMY